jgi:hypothetical protein
MAGGLVIDLCTPPPSPPPSPQRASSGGGSGCIDLCTPPSSPTAHGAPAGSKRPLSTAALPTAPVKVQRPEAGSSSSADAGPSLMEDEEVLETAAPPAPNKDVQMGDENEDVQCTGRTGDNALMDFPHARENCVAVKFVQGQVPHPPPCADPPSATWLGLGLGLGLALGRGLAHSTFYFSIRIRPPAGVQVLRELLLLRMRRAGQGVPRVGRQPLQSIAPLCRVAAAAQAVEVAAGRRRRRRRGRRRYRGPAARNGRGSVDAQARGEGVELRRLLPSAAAGPRSCPASLRPSAPALLRLCVLHPFAPAALRPCTRTHLACACFHLSASPPSPPLRRCRCTRRRSRSPLACCRRSRCAPTRSRASPS